MKRKSPKPVAARSSLKWTMLMLVIGCWVLPFVLLVTLVANYIFHSTQTQARQTVLQSVTAATQITATRLESAASASVKASYLPTLKNAWQQYQKDQNSVDLYETATTFLSQQYKYDDKFLNTVLLRTDGSNEYYYASNTAYNGTVIGVRKFVKNLGETVLTRSKTLGTEVAFVCNGDSCFLVRNLMDGNYKTFAVLVMELNQPVVFESMKNITWATDVQVWINGTPLRVQSGEKKKEQMMPQPQTEQQIFSYTQRGSAQYSVTGAVGDARVSLQYAVCGNAAPLQAQMDSQMFILVGALVLLLFLMGSVLLFFHRKVTRPVGTLMDAAAEIQKGNFGFGIAPQTMTSREFGYLGDSFNAMSDTLKNQFERIYKEELALRDAKIMALQSQINPHFLNNTLEIINWEARLAENVKVCQMLEALSTMLNAAMDRKNRPVIHLSEEMMYVDAYLYIIRERLGRRLTVQREIDADVLDCYVPRLVLQPILENAVEHGITPTQKGTITIRAYQKDHWLWLEIENDGVTTYEDLMKIQALLSAEAAEENTASTSLGIRNVNQRLKILYGEKSGLTITITEKGNTLSRLGIEIAQSAQ